MRRCLATHRITRLTTPSGSTTSSKRRGTGSAWSASSPSDLKGAKVSVVPEPPEFWNYVLTGEYVPPVNTNPITSRPIASGLAITEQQVVQGDTVFTELTVTFEISGPVGNIVVPPARRVLSEAQTTTRTATWRISHADQYTVVVRPFSPDGRAGVAASVTYITAGADVPPRLVDFFDVDELSGGVRMYTWGFLASIQSPDFAASRSGTCRVRCCDRNGSR